MPKIHQGRPATYSYPVGVLPDPPPLAAEQGPEGPSPPAASAHIAIWRAHAAALDIDTKGLTKAQIRKLVA